MPRFEDNAGDSVRFINGWKTVEENPDTFDAGLLGTLEQIVAGFYRTLEDGNGQVAPGLTAYHIWKLGAWLGFWPSISE